jgi:hypothetical protein
MPLAPPTPDGGAPLRRRVAPPPGWCRGALIGLVALTGLTWSGRAAAIDCQTILSLLEQQVSVEAVNAAIDSSLVPVTEDDLACLRAAGAPAAIIGNIVAKANARVAPPCAAGFGRAADGNCYPLEPRATDPATVDQVAFRRDADRRARGVVIAGAVVGSTGLLLDVVGSLAWSPELLIFGVVAEATGGPMMAAGSLRSAVLLRQSGVSTSLAPGYAAWGMWGGSMVCFVGSMTTYDLVAFDVFNVSSLVLRLGTYAPAAAQFAVNGSRRRAAGWTERRTVWVRPLAAGDGTVGVSISGLLR